MASRKGSASVAPVPRKKVRLERHFLLMNTPVSNHELGGFQLFIGDYRPMD
jgi:hypothetical protein